MDRDLLASLVVKRKREGSALTADEALIGWRHNFFEVFGYVDATLATTVSQKSAARLIGRRAREWFAGDLGELYAYMRFLLRWWSERKAKKEKWPSLAAPHLESDALAYRNRVNRYLDEFMCRRASRAR